MEITGSSIRKNHDKIERTRKSNNSSGPTHHPLSPAHSDSLPSLCSPAPFIRPAACPHRIKNHCQAGRISRSARARHGGSEQDAARMLEGKARVEDTDMPARMQAAATSAASRALDLFDVADCRAIAGHIKAASPPSPFSLSNFGCFFTHTSGTFIYFSLERLSFLLFKAAAAAAAAAAASRRHRMASSAAVAALDVRMRSGDGLKAAAQLVVASSTYPPRYPRSFPVAEATNGPHNGGLSFGFLLSTDGDRRESERRTPCVIVIATERRRADERFRNRRPFLCCASWVSLLILSKLKLQLLKSQSAVV
ncbi:hypothetical protein HU200_022939 [Digitaria exilis]|uniref:Dynein light chain n=1 Tax=Digitaria exilis TaxID=1010633 RepID=A0A835C679_9POAL|nr:hypothetical protein HU200_022939 [Digitaria exilis]